MRAYGLSLFLNSYASSKNDFSDPCQSYDGTLCSEYFGKEYIFVREDSNQKYIEEQLNKALNTISFSNSCSPYAKKALCMATLPLCNERTQEPIQICKEDCEILDEKLCSKEIELMTDFNSLLGPKIHLPVCSELLETESQNCISIGIDELGKSYLHT